MFHADFTVRNEYFDARELIRNKYRPLIDEVEEAIPVIKEEWFTAGKEKVIKMSREIAESLDPEQRAAIFGPDPDSLSDEISDVLSKLGDDVENDATKLAADSGAPLSSARAEVWEMKTIEDAMSSVETQKEFLGDVGSIFRGGTC